MDLTSDKRQNNKMETVVPPWFFFDLLKTICVQNYITVPTFGVIKIFFCTSEEINAFIQQRHVKLIKSDSKMFTLLPKISISNKRWSFYSSVNPEQNVKTIKIPFFSSKLEY